MIRAAVARGHVPAVDSLSEAPAGRRIDDFLPLGLYGTAAGFDRVMATFGARDLETNARWFVALAGALVVLPVFGATRAVFGDRWAAVVAALIAALLPAHLHRTWCWWLRYEPLGTTLILTHLAFGFVALSSRGLRAARVNAVLAGISLFAAVWVWRVSLLVPFIEAAFVTLFVMLRPPGRAVREWFTAVVAAESIAAIALGYQRHEAFVMSRGWLFAMALCAALHTSWLRRDGATARARLAGILAALAVAVTLGAAGARERQYAVMLHVLWAKLSGAGSPVSVANPLTALSLGVDELLGSAPGDWLGPGQLSWIGAWLVLVPLLLWWRAGFPSPVRLRSAGPAGVLLAFLCVSLLGVTVLLIRAKVILGPLVSIACGGSLVALRSFPASASRPIAARRGQGRSAPASPGRGGGGSRLLLAVAFAACVLITARDGIWLVTTRQSRLDTGLLASLEYLRSRTPPQATVLSLWERGYEIQAYAGRRTLVDGLLESPVVKRRILEIDGALMQPSSDSLAAVCRRYGAGWVLVPPSTSLLGIALVTQPPFLAKLVPPGVPLTPHEADRVVIRMMVFGQSVPPFDLVFEREGYRVYRLASAGDS
jgi:hypothetical protein